MKSTWDHDGWCHTVTTSHLLSYAFTFFLFEKCLPQFIEVFFFFFFFFLLLFSSTSTAALCHFFVSLTTSWHTHHCCAHIFAKMTFLLFLFVLFSIVTWQQNWYICQVIGLSNFNTIPSNTISQWINCLVNQMSKYYKKCSLQLPRAQIDIFKWTLLSIQQSKTQRLSIYNHKWPRKASNLHI